MKLKEQGGKPAQKTSISVMMVLGMMMVADLSAIIVLRSRALSDDI